MAEKDEEKDLKGKVESEAPVNSTYGGDKGCDGGWTRGLDGKCHPVDPTQPDPLD